MQGNGIVVGTAAGTHPACAACKHQRKKCTEVCILAPYFPADRTREFQAVHKIFGVSNVTKIVKNLKEEDRKTAVDSLVWEASWRQKDPVLGPYGEYRKVYDELKMFKSQNQEQVMQLTGQWAAVGYKVGPGLIGWNGTNNGMINNKGSLNNIGNTLNCIHDNHGNGINVDSNPYAYPLNYEDKVVKQEIKHAGSGGVPTLQHNSISGFNQQYFVPGN
ncbi:hypothetical protein F2P56_002037 [Juglans regia]|uniref:LOB domain-containing protein n=1 Tax=Juglans regia TaxID=51240 RepID=A0A833YFR9_JUGRE|nr:hypothetical protein F2P56_002037 [Juglans regia]